MKRGGELIYAGHLGHNSCKLIEFFEVIIFVMFIYFVNDNLYYYTNWWLSTHYLHMICECLGY